MQKDKLQLEYVFDTSSLNLLWNCISTPEGLSGWFADEVSQSGQKFSFRWHRHEQKAEQTHARPQIYVRFRWEDDPEDAYFELRLSLAKLTGNVTLVVTDVADHPDRTDAVLLWNQSVDALHRKIGV